MIFKKTKLFVVVYVILLSAAPTVYAAHEVTPTALENIKATLHTTMKYLEYLESEKKSLEQTDVIEIKKRLSDAPEQITLLESEQQSLEEEIGTINDLKKQNAYLRALYATSENLNNDGRYTLAIKTSSAVAICLLVYYNIDTINKAIDSLYKRIEQKFKKRRRNNQ